ncbi:MAG: hypothetical protein IH897_14745, partial [Planctomycetes bacterium]|nr:hypothetical protein [Planctomycetota bacterium]
MAQPFVMPHGRHKGKSIQRIPINYLKWMVNARHSHGEHARGELRRRGTVTPNLEISGHALNRASMLLWGRWEATRHENEGLHAWLVRMSEAALKFGRAEYGCKDRLAYRGMSFRFEIDCEWPVLKTVMPMKREKEMQKAVQIEETIEEPVDYADDSGNVRERLHGYTTGPTLWQLRVQVKRDRENATDRQKLVPYSVVLAYCEQVGEESVKYLNVKLARLENRRL